SAAVGSCHHARGGEPGERGKEERSGERPKAAARPPRGGDVLFGTGGGRLGVGAPCRPGPRRPGVSHALFLAGKRVPGGAGARGGPAAAGPRLAGEVRPLPFV